MAAYQFYHLTTSPLERALPKLLEKSYSGGYRAVVLFDSNERVEQFNTLLWTYDPNSFLPHGSTAEEGAHHILLTSELPPQASGEKDILFITNGASAEGVSGYSRVIDMFDGGHSESLNAARARWKSYKDKGLDLTYFKQDEKGSWIKAA